jgi:competence protein ComEC
MVFISHGHSDHMGAYQDLVGNFVVKKTYSSYYDDTELLSELKNKHEIYLLKSDDKITFLNLTFYILGPIKKYTNENDNSLVMKVVIEDLSILFTGDIELEAEEDLVDKYGAFLKSDILKVPHHGSNTSATKMFLDNVSPEYLLISVGRNNYYGFPNNKDILSYQKIYRTDLDYSISIYKRKKLFYIK